MGFKYAHKIMSITCGLFKQMPNKNIKMKTRPSDYKPSISTSKKTYDEVHAMTLPKNLWIWRKVTVGKQWSLCCHASVDIKINI